MRFLLFSVICLVLAESISAKEKIIDLGQIEIQGEVRRPPIQVIDTNESLQKMIRRMKIKKLAAFEKKMLRPKQTSKEGREYEHNKQ